MLFLLGLKWNLYEKPFSCVTTKTNSSFDVNLNEMLKEGTINFSIFFFQTSLALLRVSSLGVCFAVLGERGLVKLLSSKTR